MPRQPQVIPQRTSRRRAETRASTLAMDRQGHLTILHLGFDDDVRVSILIVSLRLFLYVGITRHPIPLFPSISPSGFCTLLSKSNDLWNASLFLDTEFNYPLMFAKYAPKLLGKNPTYALIQGCMVKSAPLVCTSFEGGLISCFRKL